MSEEQVGLRVSEYPGPRVSVRVRAGVGLEMRVPPVSPHLALGSPSPLRPPSPAFSSGRKQT